MIFLLKTNTIVLLPQRSLDVTLTEDNVNDSADEAATTPKASKRTPKVPRTASHDADEDKSDRESVTPKLRRTKSMNSAKTNSEKKSKLARTPSFRVRDSKVGNLFFLRAISQHK